MTIACTYEDGVICQHFGHSPAFKLYTVEYGKVSDSRVLSSDGQGHGALAVLLSSAKVDVLICGGIGPGAVNALSDSGIEVWPGAAGDPDAAVAAYLSGSLVKREGANCSHHDHGEGHDCHHGHEDGHQCHHGHDGGSCSCHS